MPGTKPKVVDSSNQLQMGLSRWDTDGGAVRGPSDEGFRTGASPHTRHGAGKPGSHAARISIGRTAQTCSRNDGPYFTAPGPYATSTDGSSSSPDDLHHRTG